MEVKVSLDDCLLMVLGVDFPEVMLYDFVLFLSGMVCLILFGSVTFALMFLKPWRLVMGFDSLLSFLLWSKVVLLVWFSLLFSFCLESLLIGSFFLVELVDE